MAYLHNSNGIDYEIISSRKSKVYKGHKDYVVRNSVSGSVAIVHGWNPKRREWANGSYYGVGDKALITAKKDFKGMR